MAADIAIGEEVPKLSEFHTWASISLVLHFGQNLCFEEYFAGSRSLLPPMLLLISTF